jgi:hypothetical protein
MPFNLFGDLDTNGNVFQPPPYGYIGFGAGTTSAGLSQIEISNLNISMVEGALPSASTPEPGTAGTLIVGSGFLFALMFYRRQRSTRKE